MLNEGAFQEEEKEKTNHPYASEDPMKVRKQTNILFRFLMIYFTMESNKVLL